MPSTTTLAVFAVATLALLAVPGPSVLFVLARSLEHGRRAGLWSVLGIESGALVHVAAAAAGLSALVASSDAALTVVRWAGAGYLFLLAVQQLRRSRAGSAAHAGPTGAGAGPAGSPSRWSLFRTGVLVDLLNPKTSLFFLAFLPQFVDPAAGATWSQVAVLGLVFVTLAALTDGVVALAAGGLSARLTGGGRRRRRMDRATAGVYAGLGALVVAG